MKTLPTIVLAALASSLAPATLAQTSQDTNTGSHFQRAITKGDMPEKPWDQLTEDQRAAVRKTYENMPATDDPPYPLQGMLELNRGFARVQKDIHLKGLFWAAVRIDEMGKARAIKVFQTPDVDANKALAFVVMHAQYKPALCAGKPCVMDFPVRVEFSPESEIDRVHR